MPMPSVHDIPLSPLSFPFCPVLSGVGFRMRTSSLSYARRCAATRVGAPAPWTRWAAGPARCRDAQCRSWYGRTRRRHDAPGRATNSAASKRRALRTRPLISAPATPELSPADADESAAVLNGNFSGSPSPASAHASAAVLRASSRGCVVHTLRCARKTGRLRTLEGAGRAAAAPRCLRARRRRSNVAPVEARRRARPPPATSTARHASPVMKPTRIAEPARPGDTAAAVTVAVCVTADHGQEVPALELARQKRMAANQQRLAELGLQEASAKVQAAFRAGPVLAVAAPQHKSLKRVLSSASGTGGVTQLPVLRSKRLQSKRVSWAWHGARCSRAKRWPCADKCCTVASAHE
eukprot:354846-Chlamydomonas_euryale.AAC.6